MYPANRDGIRIDTLNNMYLIVLWCPQARHYISSWSIRQRLTCKAPRCKYCMFEWRWCWKERKCYSCLVLATSLGICTIKIRSFFVFPLGKTTSLLPTCVYITLPEEKSYNSTTKPFKYSVSEPLFKMNPSHQTWFLDSPSLLKWRSQINGT